MMTVVGDRDIAAIEFEIEQPRDDRWLLGRFRLHVAGGSIGDWDDTVALRAVVGWWRAFSTDKTYRWDACLDGYGERELFARLREAVYSDVADDDLVDVLARYHVNQLGMSSFDPYVVILVEPPERGQLLLWRREKDLDDVHMAHLPAGTLQRLAARFVEDFDAATGA